jgi:redox-sensing transcriptional repressor
LTESLDAGTGNVSSEELADLAGVNAAKVRKDLSYLGTYGVRGRLRRRVPVYQVRRELASTTTGRLSSSVRATSATAPPATADSVTAAFRWPGWSTSTTQDRHDRRGRRGAPARRPARHRAPWPRVDRRRRHAAGGAGRRPPGRRRRHQHPQFRPGVVAVPATVVVRKVDLAIELQILSYHEQRRPVPNARA